ncbi:hypothetical protein ALQ88_05914 [Pseudomonas savastanoi]|nr:hypothetical protein ALQ88_05914 [Pseudomonas savastanoi]
MACRELTDDTPHMGRTGEIDSTHGRVGDQTLDNRRGIGRRIADHVDDTVAQPGILQYLTDQPMHCRAELRCLEHHGVTAGKRHGDGAGSKNHRRIPRCDAEHHAAGLAQRHGKAAGHIGGNDFTGNLRGHRRSFAQHAGGQLYVEAIPVGHRPGFASGSDKFATARLQLLGSLEQARSALAGCQRRPGRERSLSSPDCCIGIFQGRCGHTRNHFASHRVTAFKCTSIMGGARLAADQQGHVQHDHSSLLLLFKGCLEPCNASLKSKPYACSCHLPLISFQPWFDALVVEELLHALLAPAFLVQQS